MHGILITPRPPKHSTLNMLSFKYFVAIYILFLITGATSQQKQCLFKKHFVERSNSSSSTNPPKCLDGSTPAYYIYRPKVPSNNWILYFESGGWCYDLKTCYDRSQTALGSSSNLPDCLDEELIPKIGYLSNVYRNNLVAHNWNKVFINYCDGSSWSSDVAGDKVTYKEKTLYFRGLSNRIGVINSLLASDAGLKDAGIVVVSGKSAGALGVLIGIDHIASMIRSVNSNSLVLGLADSGYFMDYDSPYKSAGMSYESKSTFTGFIDVNNKKFAEEIDLASFKNIYASKMKNINKMMNMESGLPKSCVEKFGTECVFAERLVPFIDTPTFLLQPVYDSWQLKHVLGSLPDSTAHDRPNGRDTATIIEFGYNLTHQLMSILQEVGKSEQSSRDHIGVFFDYCSHHGFSSDNFRSIRGQIAISSAISPLSAPFRRNTKKLSSIASTGIRGGGALSTGSNGSSSSSRSSLHTANTAFYTWYQKMLSLSRRANNNSNNADGAILARAALNVIPFPCDECCAVR